MILTITLEVYIEMMIKSFINIQTAEFNLFGEKLGSIISYTCIFLAGIFLPGSLIYVYVFKSQKDLRSV